MQAGNVSQPVRVVLWIGGLLAGLLLGGLLVALVLTLAFLPGDSLPRLLQVNPRFPWYLSRASGTVAYLLLTASTAWGLILSTKIAKEITPPPFTLGMHNAVSWVALGLAGLHAWLLLLDTYYVYLPFHLLIPFTGPYRPGWVGLGTISLYLMIMLSASFGWRKFIGQKGWRLLHHLSFPTFVFVTLHGLMAGTDSAGLGMQMLFAASGLLVLFLTNYRLLVSAKRR